EDPMVDSGSGAHGRPGQCQHRTTSHEKLQPQVPIAPPDAPGVGCRCARWLDFTPDDQVRHQYVTATACMEEQKQWYHHRQKGEPGRLCERHVMSPSPRMLLTVASS